jgi:hypothetical protein
MGMLTKDDLLTLAGLYADATGKRLSTIGVWLFNDGKKLAAIAAGADLHSGNLNAAVVKLSDHWPSDLDWPAGILRPERVMVQA